MLASDDDPRIGMAPARDDYHRLIGLLDQFYNLIVLDTGTGILDSANRGLLTEADRVVLVVRAGARRRPRGGADPGLDGSARLRRPGRPDRGRRQRPATWRDTAGPDAPALREAVRGGRDRPVGRLPRAGRPDRHVVVAPSDPGEPHRHRGSRRRQLREAGDTVVTGAAIAARLLLGAVLLTGAVGSGKPGADQQRDLDVVASAQPTDLQPEQRDAVFTETVTGRATVRADLVATTSTTCHGCAGESAGLRVLYLTGVEQAQLDNVATAWTRDCWDCSATALAVQVVVVPGRPGLQPANRSFSVTDACATCRTAAAAFRVVVTLDPVTRFPEQTLAELRARFAEQETALRAAVTAPPHPRAARGAAGAATIAVTELRRLATVGPGSRVWSARVDVSR
ncbi:hypothetical protein [Nocardioides sp. B-3]|uniref:hypothetical protein n=1 Tax=Nocardioides sp. B-3 TaxID=2895565 RepID=UPI0021538619|nr:hypothetical protein [Nocardioides sp. B-3]UUZ61244.1 hypothetical protein LP418_11965 [Nocardioides sp. B-3]